MEWKDQRESANVEDRRGMPIGRTAAVGGGLGTLVLALIYMFLGDNPNDVLQNAPPAATAPTAPSQPYQESAHEADYRKLASVVLAETEDVWGEVFREHGAAYQPPKLVLYTRATSTGCGVGQAAMGPFYCPNDRRVFLDLAFFDEMRTRMGAGGDFAYAYVIAHEVGHHVQNLLGIADRAQGAEQRYGAEGASGISVRVELQADCFAGVWASRTQRQKNVLEPGDVEAALNAAAAVGDDTLQKAARGYAVPDTFTHGSSAQRMRWFKRGFDAGRLENCDTFGARQL